MPRKRRWPLRLLLLLLILVVIPIAAAPFVPLNPLKPAVESRLSNALGRKVTVNSLRLNLLGGPYLNINGMIAREDPAFGEGNFLEADQVRANIAAMPLLLRRQIEIEGLDIKSPRFTFVKNSEGMWSWTTLGQAVNASDIRVPAHPLALHASNFLALTLQVSTGAAISSFQIEDASVRLVDKTGVQPPESLYKNVELRASIDRPSGAAPNTNSHAKGRLLARYDEASGAELFRADMPFDLVIDRAAPRALSAQGTLGPGHLESKNFAAESFKSAINMKERTVTLDQMEMSLYEGSLRGRMELDLRTQRFSAEGEVQNLNLDQAFSSKLQMLGQITGHIDSQFKLTGIMRDFQQLIPTVSGSGRMSSNQLFIASVNVSDQVARALKISQIGDMNPGTTIGSLESDFYVEQGVVKTHNLRIQQMDGLGDATANHGWFDITSAPTLNYAARVLLSSEATAQVKASSPMVGALVAFLAYNNRFAVAVSITGEVSNPQVQVDLAGTLLQ